MNLAAISNQPRQVGSLLLGADEFVGRFVAQRLGVEARFVGGFTALGVVRRGVFVGGVVYYNYMALPHGATCEVALAFDNPAWALPGTLKALCDYPFNQLGCVRVTAITAKANKRARRWLEGFGFNREGVHPRGIDGKQTAISYGMLKEDCRWLKGK